MKDIDNDKLDEAKKTFDLKKYSLATKKYEELWNNSNKKSYQLFFYYGKSLQKNGEYIKFIELYDSLNDDLLKENKYIISVYCWCIYYNYIKKYEITDIEGFIDFVNNAQKIVNIIPQLDEKNYIQNPYVLTIFKVVKVLRKRSIRNYRKIIEWLSLLNPKELPNNEYFQFTDKNGKNREIASYREIYYQYLAEAYEKIEDYNNCIKICDIFFNEIEKIHYRNGLWMKSRKIFSECMILEDKESSLEKYRKMAEKDKFWFMYYKLSNLYMRFAKPRLSLLYACKAICQKFEKEKMIKVLMDIGLLLNNSGDYLNARIFFQASGYYRKVNGWNIPEELEYEITNNKIDINIKPNIRLLKKIADKYIDEIEFDFKKKGKIVNINIHSRHGYIEDNKTSEKIYFKSDDLQNIPFDNSILKLDVLYYIDDRNKERKKAKEIRGVINGSNIK